MIAAIFVGAVVIFAPGCSSGKTFSEGDPGPKEPATDPCEPACCCKTKDNYYIRFNCMPRALCMVDDGVCSTDEKRKCITDTVSDVDSSS